jgi:TRAP-type C4-dicarboxylate transport system substrate-binding protein
LAQSIKAAASEHKSAFDAAGLAHSAAVRQADAKGLTEGPAREETMFRKVLVGAALAILAAVPAAAQQVTIKFNSPSPPRSYLHANVFDKWIAAVEQDSGGTLKIEKFYGGVLGNFAITYDRVVDGVADAGWTLSALTGGRFKQQDVAALPFETRDANELAIALWHIYNKGVTAKEFEQVKLLGFWAFPNAALHSSQQIRTLDDLKGKKITVSNAISARTAVLLGGTPVTMRPDEVYQALSRGVADVSMMPFNGMQTFKLDEVAKQHLDVALGGDTSIVFMNKASYDKLPAAAKAALDKNSGLALSRLAGQATQAEWERARNNVKPRVTTLGTDQEPQWKAALQPLAREWAQGVPEGAKVLEAFRAEVAAMRAGK